MPSWSIQKQAFSSFRQRVNEEYKRLVREGQSRPELAFAEARVRAALEEELLRIAIQSDEGVAESV